MNENTPDLPTNAGHDSPAEMNRRRFLEKVCVALGGVCAGLLGIPVVGFVLAPLFRKSPSEWVSVGKVADFAVGTTVNVTMVDPSSLPWAGITAKTASWLRREDETHFIAFAVNCTHMGCPVRWLADAKLFMCPCHGGVYYGDGTVAAGPPPKPLQRHEVRIADGKVEIKAAAIPIMHTL